MDVHLLKNDLRKLLVSIIFISIPTIILFQHFSLEYGFIGLIYFGRHHLERAIPEVKFINPPANSEYGYDGQWYAQMAIYPQVNREELINSMDNPAYRFRRIGMPFLAYLMGFGQPKLILQSFALINFGFWLVLLFMLIKFTDFRGNRELLTTGAILWTAGTLVSVSRSLPDLPSAILSFLPVLIDVSWIIAAASLGIAVLFKETAILSFLAYTWAFYKNGQTKRIFASIVIIFLPISLWLLYVYSLNIDGSAIGLRNFNFPFFGLYQKFLTSLNQFQLEFQDADFWLAGYLLYDIICPLSLLIQSIYLISRPLFHSKVWLLGIGFAVLLFFLGSPVWADVHNYARVLLPLTFSFNLLLLKEEHDLNYFVWFALGNIGMTWMLFITIVMLFQ